VAATPSLPSAGFGGRGVAVTPLPEIAPDGIEQNAQPSRRTAAGEKNPAAVPQRAKHRVRHLPRAARLRELAILAHHVIVRFGQQFQSGDNVAFRHLAQIRRHRMRRFGHERAEFELAGNG